MTPTLTLSVLPGRLSVCRFAGDARLPTWAESASQGAFFSLTRTPDELSLVCWEDVIPGDRADQPDIMVCEWGWRCFKVAGPLEFALVGILAALAVPLAQAGVSIFALSTYDTDYLLVKEDQMQQAVAVLRGAGHTVHLP